MPLLVPGQAYFFDGTDDYMEAVTDAPLSDFSGQGFTVEVVFSPTDIKNNQVLISRIGLNANGNPYLLMDGQWHTALETNILPESCNHLSVVVSEEQILFYLNGSLEFTSYHGASLPELRPLESFYFGAAAGSGFSDHFLGTMEELRIFSDVRSEIEIQNFLFLPLDIANDNRYAYYDFHDFLADHRTTDPFYYHENQAYLGGQVPSIHAMPQLTSQICMAMAEGPESIGSPYCSGFQWACNPATVANPAEMLCNGNFEQYCSALNSPPVWAIAPHAFNTVGNQGATGSDVVNWEQSTINLAPAGSPPIWNNSTPDFYVRGGLGTTGSGFNLQVTAFVGNLVNPPTNTHNGSGNAFVALMGQNKPIPGQNNRIYMERIRTELKAGQTLTAATTYQFSGWFFKSIKGSEASLPPSFQTDPGSIKVYFTDAGRNNLYFADSVLIQDASRFVTGEFAIYGAGKQRDSNYGKNLYLP